MNHFSSSFLTTAVSVLILARCIISAETFTEGVRVSPETVTLKPGEYVWEPERAPEGPLLIVASITEQVAYVYRNGIRIARSSVSTGRPGHRTPTGVFTILEKEVHHTSSIYKGAEMPYMERVTWSGIALHAGDLPGYPDSHGCVRLPLEFSKLLFGVTMKGATVIIGDEHSAPAETVHPGLFFAQNGQESEPIAARGSLTGMLTNRPPVQFRSLSAARTKPAMCIVTASRSAGQEFQIHRSFRL